VNQQKEILVVGHKSPDTDSICSAIAYANLKNKLTGQQYTPRRAGDLNKETAFALSYFGVEPPAYLADVRTRVSDMEIKEVPAVNAKISIKQAYSLMKECEASTLCITNEENHLEGLITISNVAASDMDVYDNRMPPTHPNEWSITLPNTTWSSSATALNRSFSPLKSAPPASSCAPTPNPMKPSSSAPKARVASSCPALMIPTPLPD